MSCRERARSRRRGVYVRWRSTADRAGDAVTRSVVLTRDEPRLGIPTVIRSGKPFRPDARSIREFVRPGETPISLSVSRTNNETAHARAWRPRRGSGRSAGGRGPWPRWTSGTAIPRRRREARRCRARRRAPTPWTRRARRARARRRSSPRRRSRTRSARCRRRRATATTTRARATARRATARVPRATKTRRPRRRRDDARTTTRTARRVRSGRRRNDGSPRARGAPPTRALFIPGAPPRRLRSKRVWRRCVIRARWRWRKPVARDERTWWRRWTR